MEQGTVPRPTMKTAIETHPTRREDSLSPRLLYNENPTLGSIGSEALFAMRQKKLLLM